MTDTQAAGMQKGAVHLSDVDFEQMVKDAGKPVFVDFYADWCGPCKMAAPIVDKLADELRDQVMIAKLSVDDSRNTAQAFGVMSIPTVVIVEYKDDKVVELDRKIGFPGEEGYRQFLAPHLKSAE